MRLLPLVTFLAATALADRRDDIMDRFASLTAALSADNAAAAIKVFDPAMPGYAELRTQIYALLDRASVASSIDLLSETGDDTQASVELDWNLEIKGKEPGGSVARRRETVRCRLERQKKEWRIVSMAPADFLR